MPDHSAGANPDRHLTEVFAAVAARRATSSSARSPACSESAALIAAWNDAASAAAAAAASWTSVTLPIMPPQLAWARDEEELDAEVQRVEYLGPEGDWRWAGALEG